jgi:hemerythrin superfamily protein
MSDTKIRIQKATQILKEDHEKVKELFAEYEDQGDLAHAGKMHLFLELKRELTIHAQIEEEIFYPSIQESGELVAKAIEEHALVKTLLEELSSLNPRDEEFDAKMKVLQENVLHHAKEEEKDLFPCFEELDEDERDAISERLRQRKMDLQGEYE